MDELIEQFKQFPGIGPRQAKRFVHFLLTHDKSFADEFAENIKQSRSATHTCTQCYRLFLDSGADICNICSDDNRDTSTLLVVEDDADLDNIEDKHVYDGLYFVLGGTLPVVTDEPHKQIRIRKLFDRVQEDAKNGTLEEIILATSANPEGENTARFITNKLRPLVDTYDLTISELGRGLSSGTELEYVDENTIKHALKGRN
jgi:recombination protein RecR